MKKAIIPLMFAVGLLFLTSTSTLAADSLTGLKVQAGILPHSPFYVFDIAFEEVRAVFAISDETKALVYANIAEERLAESNELVVANNSANVDAIVQDYQNAIAKSQKHASLSNEPKLKAEIETRLEAHLDVLESIRLTVPDNAKFGIQNALTNSQKAVESIGQGKNSSG